MRRSRHFSVVLPQGLVGEEGAAGQSEAVAHPQPHPGVAEEEGAGVGLGLLVQGQVVCPPAELAGCAVSLSAPPLPGSSPALNEVAAPPPTDSLLTHPGGASRCTSDRWSQRVPGPLLWGDWK